MLNTAAPHAQNELPAQITSDWSGTDVASFDLLYTFPRIWTQKQSRVFGLYWSRELGQGKLYPTPTPQELNAFYDIETYDAYLSGNAAKSGTPPVWARLLRRLAWRQDDSEPPASRFLAERIAGTETVCDIGCGSGALLADLHRLGCQPVGVDPSDVSIAALERAGIRALHGTAEDLPVALKDEQFDLVCMQQSLEHCLNPEQALRNLHGICAEGGHCLIEVPNHENLGFWKYGPAWYHTDAGRHLHFFTAQSLTDLLRHVGFTPIHVGYLSYTRQFDPAWIIAMQEVWDSLYAAQETAPVPRPRISDTWRDFLAFPRTDKAKSYDVLRVYCAVT